MSDLRHFNRAPRRRYCDKTKLFQLAVIGRVRGYVVRGVLRSSRDVEAYQQYQAWCKRIGVGSADFETWFKVNHA